MSKRYRFLMRLFILIALSLAVVYTLYSSFTKDEGETVSLHKQAPDFSLTDLNGVKHQLSQLKGKGVMVNFWGTWCKPCEREMPYMQNQYEEFKDKGVEILAINVGESQFLVSKFVERHKLSFPILIDVKSQVQNAYFVNPLPVTFLIDKNGKVIDSTTGSLSEENIRNMLKRIQP